MIHFTGVFSTIQIENPQESSIEYHIYHRSLLSLFNQFLSQSTYRAVKSQGE